MRSLLTFGTPLSHWSWASQHFKPYIIYISIIYLQINFTVFCHKYLIQGLAVLKPSIFAWKHSNSMSKKIHSTTSKEERTCLAWYQEKKNEHWHWHLLTGRADDSRCSDKTRRTLTSVSASEPEPRRLTHNMLLVKKKLKETAGQRSIVV